MSEQRWAVLGDEARNGWIVVHPGDVFRGGDGLLECWGIHSRHDTWAEAMQEAGRMARTVTVTLPANPGRVMPETATMMRSEAGGIWIERTYRAPGGQDITIPDAYRETIALTLLAHARKETN